MFWTYLSTFENASGSFRRVGVSGIVAAPLAGSELFSSETAPWEAVVDDASVGKAWDLTMCGRKSFAISMNSL